MKSNDIQIVGTADARDIYNGLRDDYEFYGYDIVLYFLAIKAFYDDKELWKIYDKATIRYPEEFLKRKGIENYLLQYERYRDTEFPAVYIGAGFTLINGTFKVALALYHHDFKFICHVSDDQQGKTWNTFKLVCINLDENELTEVYAIKSYLDTACQHYFIGILWPAVSKYFDEITNELSAVYDIAEYYDLSFTEAQFDRVIIGSYKIDDSTDDMILKKINAMKGLNKSIRVLKFILPNPDYRFKVVPVNDLNLVVRKIVSKEVERTKALVRKTYKDKIDYYFDIIMHMSDNFYQSKYLEGYFDFYRNMSELKISGWHYNADENVVIVDSPEDVKDDSFNNVLKNINPDIYMDFDNETAGSISVCGYKLAAILVK